MTETPRNLIPPLSPTKQLILRLAAQVARLHDSEPEALDLIAEARAYLKQPEPERTTLKQQALEAFEAIKLEGNRARVELLYSDWAVIRRAVQALSDD